MDSKLRKALDAQDWQSIMVKLYAHSIFRLNWFGIKSEMRLQGKTFEDFATEAVTLVYEGKRNWDPQKYPDIIKYLKQVINSLISNLIKSDEAKRTLDADLTEEINDIMLFDDMFEKKMINQDLIDQIEDTVLDDPDMWIVFTDLAKGMTPIDIAEKYENMEIEKIRNIQKRLRRHIRNIRNL